MGENLYLTRRGVSLSYLTQLSLLHDLSLRALRAGEMERARRLVREYMLRLQSEGPGAIHSLAFFLSLVLFRMFRRMRNEQRVGRQAVGWEELVREMARVFVGAFILVADVFNHEWKAKKGRRMLKELCTSPFYYPWMEDGREHLIVFVDKGNKLASEVRGMGSPVITITISWEDKKERKCEIDVFEMERQRITEDGRIQNVSLVVIQHSNLVNLLTYILREKLFPQIYHSLLPRLESREFLPSQVVAMLMNRGVKVERIEKILMDMLNTSRGRASPEVVTGLETMLRIIREVKRFKRQIGEENYQEIVDRTTREHFDNVAQFFIRVLDRLRLAAEREPEDEQRIQARVVESIVAEGATSSRPRAEIEEVRRIMESARDEEIRLMNSLINEEPWALRRVAERQIFFIRRGLPPSEAFDRAIRDMFRLSRRELRSNWEKIDSLREKVLEIALERLERELNDTQRVDVAVRVLSSYSMNLEMMGRERGGELDPIKVLERLRDEGKITLPRKNHEEKRFFLSLVNSLKFVGIEVLKVSMEKGKGKIVVEKSGRNLELIGRMIEDLRREES